MMKVIKNLKSIITLLISICILVLLLILINHFSSDLFQNMFKKAPWVQHETKTNTSITRIESKSELITARMNLDFINQLEGKDGRYIEILTYEITAGLSGDDYCIKVLHADQKDALILRDKIGVENFDSYTKPVKLAYEQKAKDYAVENGILETAKTKGEKLLKNLSDSNHSFTIEDYFAPINLPQLPLNLNIGAKCFADSNFGDFILIADANLSTDENRFMRDSLVLRPSDKSKHWSISIGDTGMTFTGNYKDFYRNIVETNTKKDISINEQTEIFRYFDPQNPNSTEVISFASDLYRTFFVLKGARIYYINADYTNEQELSEEIAPYMVYLAASLKPQTGEQDDFVDAYERYIKMYAKVTQNIRQNEDVYTLENNVLNLIKNNIPYLTDNGDRPLTELTQSNGEYYPLTPDEKLFYKLYNTKNNKSVYKTDDDFINNSTNLYISLLDPDLLNNPSHRHLLDQLLNQTTEAQNKKYRTYLYSYYLQNTMQLQLQPEEPQQYKDYISKSSPILFSRDAIIDMNWQERNEYFKNIFINQLKNSRRIIDTAENSTDLLPSADFEDNKFLYFDVDIKKYPPEEILKEIKTQNKNHPVNQCFILVFRQTEWNWGNIFKDTDIHALILDDAALRMFPNVAENKFSETADKRVKAFFTNKTGIPFYYYGDWESLQINPASIKINGQSFETRRLTSSGRINYTLSNEYAELSTMAQVLSNLQHAYYLEAPEYYLNVIKDSVIEEMNFYIYKKIFRPSPRLTINKTEDKMKRYNY